MTTGPAEPTRSSATTLIRSKLWTSTAPKVFDCPTGMLTAPGAVRKASVVDMMMLLGDILGTIARAPGKSARRRSSTVNSGLGPNAASGWDEPRFEGSEAARLLLAYESSRLQYNHCAYLATANPRGGCCAVPRL